MCLQIRLYYFTDEFVDSTDGRIAAGPYTYDEVDAIADGWDVDTAELISECMFTQLK